MMSLVCRKKQTTEEMARVGIDGGFWTSRYFAGFVRYARHIHKDKIWNRTLRGPKARKSSLLLVWRLFGCGGNGTIEIFELDVISGWGSDSIITIANTSTHFAVQPYKIVFAYLDTR